MVFSAYASLALWFQRHFLSIIGTTLLSAGIGFGADRLVGGRIAEIAGRVQFIFLVAYFFLSLNFFIFRPYQGRVGVILRSEPVRLLSALLGCLILAFAIFAIGFAAHSIVRDDL